MLVVDHSLPGFPTRIATEEELADRHALGHDRFDEMWDGVLHMTPSPTGDHQRIERGLLLVLHPLAEKLGLEAFCEYSVMDPSNPFGNFRDPDVLIVDPSQMELDWPTRGVALAVEVRSPYDDTYNKFGFYADREVPEVLVIHPTPRTIEHYRLVDGNYVRSGEDPPGTVTLDVVPVAFTRVHDSDGTPKLRADWPDGCLFI